MLGGIFAAITGEIADDSWSNSWINPSNFVDFTDGILGGVYDKISGGSAIRISEKKTFEEPLNKSLKESLKKSME